MKLHNLVKVARDSYKAAQAVAFHSSLLSLAGSIKVSARCQCPYTKREMSQSRALKPHARPGAHVGSILHLIMLCSAREILVGGHINNLAESASGRLKPECKRQRRDGEGGQVYDACSKASAVRLRHGAELLKSSSKRCGYRCWALADEELHRYGPFKLASRDVEILALLIPALGSVFLDPAMQVVDTGDPTFDPQASTNCLNTGSSHHGRP